MKPSTLTDFKVRGDLGGRKIALSFDENSVQHIMSVLTDLYSDPELAIIREYSTNAYDSHIEAGINKPIEVFTPTKWSPFFKVIDHGVGLSAEDIENIYSKYGASTKRDTNEQTGMLGLGCKSALTYTDQFTLIGVKDGIKTFVNISRNAVGAGVMEVVDSSATDQPNGVEIQIPVKPVNSLEAKSTKFFRFWPVGAVLLNGGDPVKRDTLNAIGNNTYLVPGDSPDVIVMGNVSYALGLGYHLYASGIQGYHFVHFARMGVVDFTPSREQLHMTTRTTRYIQDVKVQAMKDLPAWIESHIAKASTKGEALKIYTKWLSLARHFGDLKFRGEKIPSTIRIPADQKAFTLPAHMYSSRAIDSFGTNTANFPLFITGFPCQSVSTAHKKKIKKYIVDNSLNDAAGALVVSMDTFGNGWFDELPMVKWEEIAKIQLPKQSIVAKKAIPLSYLTSTDGGYFQETVTFDPKKSILYWHSVDYRDNLQGQMRNLSTRWKCHIVSLPKNRLNKFKETYPRAESVRDYGSKWVHNIWDSLTDDEKNILWSNNSYIHREFELDISQVKDPKLKHLLLLKAKKVTMDTQRQSDAIYAEDVNRWLRLGTQRPSARPLDTATLSKYPLVKQDFPKHNLLYVNYIYEVG